MIAVILFLGILLFVILFMGGMTWQAILWAECQKRERRRALSPAPGADLWDPDLDTGPPVRWRARVAARLGAPWAAGGGSVWLLFLTFTGWGVFLTLTAMLWLFQGWIAFLLMAGTLLLPFLAIFVMLGASVWQAVRTHAAEASDLPPPVDAP